MLLISSVSRLLLTATSTPSGQLFSGGPCGFVSGANHRVGICGSPSSVSLCTRLPLHRPVSAAVSGFTFTPVVPSAFSYPALPVVVIPAYLRTYENTKNITTIFVNAVTNTII
jgi:hypothetical protein